MMEVPRESWRIPASVLDLSDDDRAAYRVAGMTREVLEGLTRRNDQLHH